MDPLRWERATAIFEEAAGLEGEARAAYLDEACGAHTELRRLVDRMLAADTGTHELLDGVREWAGLLDGEESIPAALGPYRILGEVGRGGMGTVYLGERADGRFERTVALKVVRGDFASREVLERFEAEARILAGLEHPHIARLYDVGVHDGRPYLVMEYVEGQRIDRWCDERRLDVRARLDLLRQVCGAVQFAHQNLVIHRDLKPSNILVAADGSVRLLDFGVAKLLRPTEEGDEATATRFGAFTPEYASPEQLQGRELTTGTDVYSLGVILYELLTGQRPFETTPGDWVALGERASREPSSPSSVVTRPHERRTREGTRETVTPDAVGQARRSTPAHLRRLLRGDIDRISLKALRPDPGERYASAEALGEDVARYLAGRPVTARGDSVAYRAATFVRRHKVGVGVATTVALALATSATVATRQAALAREQRDRAERAFSFLQDLIASPDPVRGAGVAADSVRMVDFIDYAATRIDQELTDDPEARAEMLSLLGRVYINLGRGDEALQVLQGAVEANRAAFGASTRQAEALGRLGFAYDQFGDREQGEALIREALDMATAADPSGSAEVARWREFLARSLLDSRRLDEAEPLLQAVYDWRRVELGPDDPETVRTLVALGSLYSLQGDLSRAIATLEEALEGLRRAGLDGNPDFGITGANLALFYDRAGRLEDADRAATEAVATLMGTLGPGHFLTASTLARSAGVRGRLGRAEEADSMYRAALASFEAGAAQNVAFAVELGNYAAFLRGRGRPAEAEAMARRGVEASARIVGEMHPIYAGALLRAGDAVLDQGRVADAVALLERATSVFTGTLGEGHLQTQEAQVSLARAWADAGRVDEARTLLEGVARAAAESRGEDDRIAASAREELQALGSAGAEPGPGSGG